VGELLSIGSGRQSGFPLEEPAEGSGMFIANALGNVVERHGEAVASCCLLVTYQAVAARRRLSKRNGHAAGMA
jgi:hypothetical protein